MGNITENDMAPQKDAFFRSKKKYNPINKEDNFNVFNWSKWDLDIRIPSDTHDNDFASFQNFPQNIYIRDGILFILPKLLTEMQGFNENRIRRGTLDLGTNCTGKHFDCRRVAHSFNILPPIVSSRITTKNHFSFKYGKIQIKAKLPKGDWLFPQLFLEPLNNYYGDYDYESGQIRLAFIRGNEKSAKYWNNSENNMAPFDQKFYLSFGVSAGGLSDFPDSCIDKPWKNYDPKNELKFWQAKDDWYPTWRGEDTALKIDYVRVWSL
ncbi:beta-1,3-glucan-binding protein-like [Condylostylus longicornis]|uniref:beta-1,3-glucan-binding protein-like n=1 Tax=Condylostylus longicornis TaxID=2530218 RepID=UPI00244E2FCD|nr:beta-1,3-glucan-binding protein-like [Condylostylus longicornis]